MPIFRKSRTEYRIRYTRSKNGRFAWKLYRPDGVFFCMSAFKFRSMGEALEDARSSELRIEGE